MFNDPFLIIISSPSGAGKSTLCKMILQNDPLIKLSVSVTTRPKRDKEIDGVDYHFITKEKFNELVKNDGFLEYAEVFDYHYGTLKSEVEKEFLNGNSVLFDIDWQGARQIRKKYDADKIISIFVLPPTIQELEKRLKGRAQDSIENVMKRMAKAKIEISHYDEYEFVLINDDLTTTYNNIFSIIRSKKISSVPKYQIERFIKNNLL